MPRTGKRTQRTDLLTPSVNATAPGHANGAPPVAKIPNHLPYGEKGTLERVMSAGPRQPRRPMPPPPATTDFHAPGGVDSAINSLSNWTPPSVEPLTSPPSQPGQDPLAGLIGRPDSVLQPAAPGGLAPLFEQIAQMGGSSTIADLGVRARTAGA